MHPDAQGAECSASRLLRNLHLRFFDEAVEDGFAVCAPQLPIIFQHVEFCQRRRPFWRRNILAHRVVAVCQQRLLRFDRQQIVEEELRPRFVGRASDDGGGVRVSEDGRWEDADDREAIDAR